MTNDFGLTSPNPNPVEQPLRVLIAEDDELMAEYLQLELLRLGSDVSMAPDGLAALEKLGQQPFDVLITDWMMPGMNGLQLVKEARKSLDRYLHIIMMTARGEERTTRSALEAGADDLLYKPFDQIQIELGMASAKRVVELERRLQLRNRHLAAANTRTRVAYERIKDDLKAAATMQRRLLPEPKLTGRLNFAWAFQPSIEIGGDSLGVVPLENGRYLFFNIDVSGHGIPAALNSFALHSRIAQLAPGEPEELLDAASKLNEEVLAQGGDSYLTLILGLAEENTGQIWLLRAGHPPPLLCRNSANPEFMTEGGLPIGMFPNVRHTMTTVTLKRGDRILFYSDGVTDTAEAGALTDLELSDFCGSHGDMAPNDFIGALERELSSRRQGRPPEDDISMLLVQRPRDEEEEGD